MKDKNTLIGSHVERLEDLRFLRGKGTYVGDLTRPDMIHAAVLRSPVALGRIRRIDVSRGGGRLIGGSSPDQTGRPCTDEEAPGAGPP